MEDIIVTMLAGMGLVGGGFLMVALFILIVGILCGLVALPFGLVIWWILLALGMKVGFWTVYLITLGIIILKQIF